MANKKLYLNGEWVDFPSHFTVRDPGKNEVIAEVAAADAAAARKAVESARRAFAGWRALTAMERADYIHAVIRKIAERRDEIAETITRENGKPLAQSLGEVGMTIDHFRWFAEEARRAYGRVIPNQAPGKRHLVLRQPIGVVAAIAPWNFPLVLAVRKVAPALAAGCTVILRPASQTPLSALLLAECFEAAKVPGGVFQVIAGPAEPIAQEFLANPDCRKISFTGSTEVGRRLLEGSAATITKLSLELGGHAPVIVFEDADMDLAVEGALVTKFRNTGQSCIAANRIYVQSSIYEHFLERFVARAKEMKVGYGLEPGVDIGPLVNEAGLKTALSHVQNAVQSGARLMCGGKALERKDGHYLEPTVLADVPETAACMREETFAPIAPVCRFETVDEAIRQANNTPYGLAAYAYTSDLGRAWYLAESLEAGTIGINDSVPSTSNAPFGGVKESGQGRELGSEGLDAFLETKHISFGGISKPYGA
ncbi:MAG TPA: NAD-dependent succinate-semialdehyde dehydrogenase [Spirochaetia bacterium]|nr:NAD-dependent succinate-semialdehyde dehydrogenase [Spirochaetia bacterium]